MLEHSYFYFYCPDCEWDFVGNEYDAVEPHYCILCAGDSGHSVLMRMREAKPEDKPEGDDARTV